MFSRNWTRDALNKLRKPLLPKWEIFQAYLVEPDQGYTAIGLAVVARKQQEQSLEKKKKLCWWHLCITMWLLDLRLKSLNKIYFYYTDPTSVLPYGNIRCSIENRTKHGGTGVQMPLEQNQNIRCRKNCDTNFKWSKSWAKKGNGCFQLLW